MTLATTTLGTEDVGLVVDHFLSGFAIFRLSPFAGTSATGVLSTSRRGATVVVAIAIVIVATTATPRIGMGSFAVGASP